MVLENNQKGKHFLKEGSDLVVDTVPMRYIDELVCTIFVTRVVTTKQFSSRSKVDQGTREVFAEEMLKFRE